MNFELMHEGGEEAGHETTWRKSSRQRTARLVFLRNSQEAGEWGEQGVTEEVSKVRGLTNVSMPSSCVYLRASLPVHAHWSRALCAPLCNSRCAPFGLGTWTPLTVLVRLCPSERQSRSCV